VLICYLHPYDDIRLSLEAHIPAGIPVASRVGSPRGVCPRGVQYAHLEARSIGICGPGKPNFPVDPRPTYRHRGELPVPHSSLRSSRTARSSGGAPPPPPPDLLRRPRNGKLPLRTRSCKNRGRGSPTAAVHRPAAPELSKQHRDPQRRLRRLRFSSHPPLSGKNDTTVSAGRSQPG